MPRVGRDERDINFSGSSIARNGKDDRPSVSLIMWTITTIWITKVQNRIGSLTINLYPCSKLPLAPELRGLGIYKDDFNITTRPVSTGLSDNRPSNTIALTKHPFPRKQFSTRTKPKKGRTVYRENFNKTYPPLSTGASNKQ